MTVQPTEEQLAALALFMGGDHLAVEAFAGAGKTSTLKLMADATRDRGQYMAFNKAIVADSARKMPDNVGANTAHSLAFRAVGRRFAHRLDQGRQASFITAQQLRMDPLTISYGTERKVLQPNWLASHTMKSLRLFCNSADAEPMGHHVLFVEGLDPPEPGAGKVIGPNQLALRAHLVPYLRAAWEDVTRPDGQLPYTPDHYLKLWERTGPVISVEFVLFDEAQDASPVMLSIVQQQTHAQQVYVGDSFQQIYEWRGAVNALGGLGDDVARAYLTQSFRFGPAIAGAANELLRLLEAPKPLRGFDPIRSLLGPVSLPDAILTRTNAKAVGTVLRLQASGRRPCLLGGGAEMAAFARGARDLQTTGSTGYHDLACFTSWQQVLEYCVAPATRILGADLTWRQASALCPGDEVVAFDEHCAPGNGGRRYRTATVEARDFLTRPCRRVWMQDGAEVVASVEHRWLVKSGQSLRWKTTEFLRPGDEIASIGTWEQDDTRDGGWLAGIFDGEGWVGRRGLAFAQAEGVVLERARWALKERGFDFSESQHATGVVHVGVRGSLADRLRLVGSLRPDRLVNKARVMWEGMRVEASQRAVVRGVEDVGEQIVVALATSARTFIAEGLLSHNCVQDPQGDDLRLQTELVEEHGVEAILECLERMPNEREADVVVSTVHKAKGCEWAKVQLGNDFFEPDEGDLPSAGELRLMYVACTRAQQVLDVSRAGWLADLFDVEKRESDDAPGKLSL